MLKEITAKLEDQTFLAYVAGNTYKVEFFAMAFGSFHLFKIKKANPNIQNTLADHWMDIPADPQDVTDPIQFIEAFLNEVAKSQLQEMVA